MALMPKFVGQAVSSGGTKPLNTIELYLDYACPFSAKMFRTVQQSVRGLIEHTYNQPNTQIILRQHIQPWHPASLLLNEAATAVLRMAPGSFWKFSELLFEHQEEFYDTNVLHETRLQTYSRLAQLAGEIEGIDMKKFSDLLKITSPAGNAVTKDIKLMVRANRVVGVHGTPTVFFNGLEDQSISSRWTAQQWEDWCETNLKEAAVIVS